MSHAPFSQIIKLQIKIKWFVLSNDVPMLESIATHYTSLGFLKLPKIIKLNVAHVCFFIIISIMNACMASVDLLLGINELSLA